MDRSKTTKTINAPIQTGCLDKKTENVPKNSPKKSSILKFRNENYEIYDTYLRNIFDVKFIVNLSLFFFLLFFRNDRSENIDVLLSKIKDLEKQLELNKLDFDHKKMDIDKSSTQIISENIACLQKGAYVDLLNTSEPYKYGFFNRKTSNHPSIVLCTRILPKECFAFKGRKGTISIFFGRKATVSSMTLVYPQNTQILSRAKILRVFAIKSKNSVDKSKGDSKNDVNGSENKEFGQNKTDLKNYNEFYIVLIGEYKTSLDNTHIFDIKFDVTEACGVYIDVEDNFGNNDYTSLYKIDVYGNFNKI